jgi:hypothetical protein
MNKKRGIVLLFFMMFGLTVAPLSVWGLTDHSSEPSDPDPSLEPQDVVKGMQEADMDCDSSSLRREYLHFPYPSSSSDIEPGLYGCSADSLVIVRQWKMGTVRKLSKKEAEVQVSFEVLARTRGTKSRRLWLERQLVPVPPGTWETVTYHLRYINETHDMGSGGGQFSEVGWKVVTPPLPRVGLPAILRDVSEEVRMRDGKLCKNCDAQQKATFRHKQNLFETQLAVLKKLAAQAPSSQ